MTNEKVTVGRMVTATFEANNSCDETRKHAIACTATLRGGTVECVNDGSVTSAQGVQEATFSTWNNNESMNICFNGNVQRGEIQAAVDAFLLNVAEKAAAMENANTK